MPEAKAGRVKQIIDKYVIDVKLKALLREKHGENFDVRVRKQSACSNRYHAISVIRTD